MLQEGRKRDAATNALLALSFAANVAQSPKDLVRSGHVEGPGVQLMSRMMGKRKEANRNLDSGRVSHPARNKTFKEFVEDCDLALIEMTQKQHDKLVARIAKTKNPQRKKELENKFKERVQTQRELILKSNKKPKPKKFSSSPSLATKNLKKVGSKVMNSKPMERIKRFVSYTTLGGLAL